MQSRRNAPVTGRFMGGLSLIEMMIAIVIGMLLTAGIITLFSNVSGTNKVQDGLARLQENGRFAMTTIDADLRMMAAQYCSNFSGNSNANANGATMSQRAPWTFTSPIAFPDMASQTYASASAISPRLFVQGYECSSGTCSPSVPSDIPAQGTTLNSRLKGTDVLTVRFLNGGGWPVAATPAPNCGTTTAGGSVTIAPATGDDDVTSNALKFEAGNLVLYSDCQNPSLFTATGFASNTIALKQLLPGGAGGAPYCKAVANRDTRLFNFSKQFVTVTYYIKLVQDDDPDHGGALVPALVRRENGTDNELVRGVERLDFVYGVRKPDGTVVFMDAKTIDASNDATANTCIAPPSGIAGDTGCLWRAVRTVESHLLFATPNDLPITSADTAYLYTPDGSSYYTPPSASATSTVNGLKWGRKMRREFLTSTLVRNSN